MVEGGKTEREIELETELEAKRKKAETDAAYAADELHRLKTVIPAPPAPAKPKKERLLQHFWNDED